MRAGPGRCRSGRFVQLRKRHAPNSESHSSFSCQSPEILHVLELKKPELKTIETSQDLVRMSVRVIFLSALVASAVAFAPAFHLSRLLLYHESCFAIFEFY
jgi:hypothetical protein